VAILLSTDAGTFLLPDRGLVDVEGLIRGLVLSQDFSDGGLEQIASCCSVTTLCHVVRYSHRLSVVGGLVEICGLGSRGSGQWVPIVPFGAGARREFVLLCEESLDVALSTQSLGQLAVQTEMDSAPVCCSHSSDNSQ
jgi:hypothetical protein